MFDNFIDIVRVTEGYDFPRDQKDSKFLSCALTCGADYFITGDKDFEEIYKIGRTSVISVSLFKKIMSEVKKS